MTEDTLEDGDLSAELLRKEDLPPTGETNPGHSELRSPRTTRVVGAVFTGLIFSLNLTFLIWTLRSTPVDSISSLHILLVRDCDSSSSTITELHLLINIFNVILTAACNYYFQLLSSPSRKDIDKAHQDGRWLSIGVFAFRNIRVLSLKRKVICFVLTLTSLCISLLYNSITVDLQSANSWVGVVVDQSIRSDLPKIPYDKSLFDLDPETWMPKCSRNNTARCNNDEAYRMWTTMSTFSDGSGNFKRWHRMNISACEAQYSHDRVTQYGNFFLVTGPRKDLQIANNFTYLLIDNDSTHPPPPSTGTFRDSTGLPGNTTIAEYFIPPKNKTTIETNAQIAAQPAKNVSDLIDDSFAGKTTDGGDRIRNVLSDFFALPGPSSPGFAPGSSAPPFCPHNDDQACNQTSSDILSWKLFYPKYGDRANITYCLAQESDTKCRVGINRTSLAFVIACNGLQLLCMLYVLIFVTLQPIATLGDALDSFLRRPDETTRGQSSLSYSDVRRGLWKQSLDAHTNGYSERPWQRRRLRWAKAISLPWWMWTIICTVILWSLGLLSLIWSLKRGDLEFSRASFGSLNARETFTVETLSLIQTTMIANFPQVIITMLYVLWNRILSQMCLAREYASFARKRQGLRVTNPRGGAQRSSYLFSLPWKYAMTFMAIMALLHWLISRASFPVWVQNLKSSPPMPNNYTTYYHPSNVTTPPYTNKTVNSSTNQHLNSSLLPETSRGQANFLGKISSFGYCPTAILLALIVSGLGLFAVPVLALLNTYYGGSIIAGNCSAAISAACHPGARELCDTSKEIQYGVVPLASRYGQTIPADAPIRRIAFSAGPVEELVDGILYEGPLSSGNDPAIRYGSGPRRHLTAILWAALAIVW